MSIPAGRRWTKYCLRFVLAGVVLPILLCSVRLLAERYAAHEHLLWAYLDDITLMLWPSAIMLLGTAGSEDLPILALVVSVTTNSILYALIATVFLIGMARHRWLLVILVGAILLGWRALLSL